MLLKKMGFSLNEIKQHKDNLNDELFLKQRDKLINEMLNIKETVRIIDDIRKKIVNGKITLDNYELKNIETKRRDYGGYYGK